MPLKKSETWTPGPWHAVDCRNQKNGQIRIFPNERTDCGGNIANVLASNLCVDSNARLIATAPELYKALDDILADGLSSQTIRNAFDALAKARGTNE